jgi:hypothetical protein
MTSLEAQDLIAAWLSSEVRPGNALDAVFYLRKAELYEHLAREVDDQELAGRLAEVAERARARAAELEALKPPETPGTGDPDPDQ